MAELKVEIDGEILSLSDCDWVMWAACGCPVAVTMAQCGTHVCATEEQAWLQLEDTRTAVKKAKQKGRHLELVTHARWSSEIIEQFKTPCPHTPRFGAA